MNHLVSLNKAGYETVYLWGVGWLAMIHNVQDPSMACRYTYRSSHGSLWVVKQTAVRWRYADRPIDVWQTSVKFQVALGGGGGAKLPFPPGPPGPGKPQPGRGKWPTHLTTRLMGFRNPVSLTSWYGKYMYIYTIILEGFMYIPSGCLGFLPPTVLPHVLSQQIAGLIFRDKSKGAASG